MTDAPTTPLTPTPPPESPRSRRGLLVAILVVLAVLLVGAGIVIALLAFSSHALPVALASDSPSPVATSSADPSVTPAPDDDNGATETQPTVIANPPTKPKPPKPKPTPTATVDGLAFTSFSIPNATCASSESGTSPVTIQYSSTGATAAYFGINVGNAKDAPSDGPLPPNGPYTFDFQCSNNFQTWVITIVAANGDSLTKKASVAYTDPQ